VLQFLCSKEELNQLTAIMLTTAPVRKAADEQLVKLGDEMALVSPTGLLGWVRVR